MSYTLIVAEKPSAAKRIAAALSEGSPEKLSERGVSYFRINRDGRQLLIVPAVGHLFVLDEKNGGARWSYPTFSVEWKPTYSRKGSEWAKKYFDCMEKAARGADSFVSACDYDTEGSVIAWNIISRIGGAKDGGRMKFSTLTTPDLVKAYDDMTVHLDFPQIEAGLTRHQLDWYFGVNMSRALTLSLEKGGGAYRTLSTGRVQGPTLALLLKREEEIEAFKPTPYWEIELDGTVGKDQIQASHTKGRFLEKAAAEGVMKTCKGNDGKIASLEKREQKYYPQPAFDLTTLQRESYGLFGYSPKMTLDLAQNLYEQALISYPRTSSQKLPPTIGYKSIIAKLSSQLEYGELCRKLLKRDKLFPSQGKKEDPAHPAIFPTGGKSVKLNAYQKKLYDLITRRFLAAFADPAVKELARLVIDVKGETFSATGAVTKVAGWIEFYGPYDRGREAALPPVKVGDTVKVEKLSMLDKMTQPPGRYSQASILKEMEDLGLGTKATRAGILDTLYDRGYIKESSINVTDLGRAVVKALEGHCPEIVTVDLTRRFEEDMEKVENGERKREDILKEAEGQLTVILSKFKKDEVEIGKEIGGALKEFEKEQNTIGKCPKCGKGDMMVIRSQKTGKRFAGCNNYPKCVNSRPLPQKGSLSVSKKTCSKCGLGLVEIKGSGRRPWTLCIEHGFDYSDKKFVPADKVKEGEEKAKPQEKGKEKAAVKAAPEKKGKGKQQEKAIPEKKSPEKAQEKAGKDSKRRAEKKPPGIGERKQQIKVPKFIQFVSKL